MNTQTNSSLKNSLNFLLLVAFTVCAFVGIMHHEIWLDEAHHLLLARDSTSLSDLLINMRYEGHPILWNFILFILTRFTTDVISMQTVHVLIAIAAVYVFLFYSPFRSIEKILFIFSYFMLYEYTVISRNYVLMIFFLFLSLVLYSRTKYILLGTALAILANTHLFGLFIASCFVVLLAFETWITKTKKVDKQLIIGVTIFLLGAILSVWQIIPPTDSKLYTYGQRSSEIQRLARTSVVFLKSFFPIPDLTNYHFWNTNLLMTWSKSVCVAISFVLMLYPLIILRTQLSRIIFFYCGSALMLLFIFLSDHNALRYYGIIYLLFVSSMWLARTAKHKYDIPILKNLPLPISLSNQNFFLGLLLINAIAGIIALTLDLIRPFSESKRTAACLLKDGSIQTYLTTGCGVAPISAYLGKKIYYLNQQSYGSFCYFHRENSAGIYDTEKSLKEALLWVEKNQQSVLFITHQSLGIGATENVDVQLIAKYEKSVVRNENFYIYKISQ